MASPRHSLRVLMMEDAATNAAELNARELRRAGLELDPITRRADVCASRRSTAKPEEAQVAAPAPQLAVAAEEPYLALDVTVVEHPDRDGAR